MFGNSQNSCQYSNSIHTLTGEDKVIVLQISEPECKLERYVNVLIVLLESFLCKEFVKVP